MSVRERTWISNSGVRRQAIVVDYSDANGKRRLRTFKHRIDAERFAAFAGNHERKLELRVVVRRLREVCKLMNALADDLMELGST